jgi:hypothetical protein
MGTGFGLGHQEFETLHHPQSPLHVMRLIQPPIQWVPGTLSPEVKRPGHGADHSALTSAEAKKTGIYTFIASYVFMGQCLVKYRDSKVKVKLSP